MKRKRVLALEEGERQRPSPPIPLSQPFNTLGLGEGELGGREKRGWEAKEE